MFPKAKKAGMDMTELGGEIEVRKVELMDLYESEGGNGTSANAVDSEDDQPLAMSRRRYCVGWSGRIDLNAADWLQTAASTGVA